MGKHSAPGKHRKEEESSKTPSQSNADKSKNAKPKGTAKD